MYFRIYIDCFLWQHTNVYLEMEKCFVAVVSIFARKVAVKHRFVNALTVDFELLLLTCGNQAVILNLHLNTEFINILIHRKFFIALDFSPQPVPI